MWISEFFFIKHESMNAPQRPQNETVQTSVFLIMSPPPLSRCVAQHAPEVKFRYFHPRDLGSIRLRVQKIIIIKKVKCLSVNLGCSVPCKNLSSGFPAFLRQGIMECSIIHGVKDRHRYRCWRQAR